MVISSSEMFFIGWRFKILIFFKFVKITKEKGLFFCAIINCSLDKVNNFNSIKENNFMGLVAVKCPQCGADI